MDKPVKLVRVDFPKLVGYYYTRILVLVLWSVHIVAICISQEMTKLLKQNRNFRPEYPQYDYTSSCSKKGAFGVKIQNGARDGEMVTEFPEKRVGVWAKY